MGIAKETEPSRVNRVLVHHRPFPRFGQSLEPTNGHSCSGPCRLGAALFRCVCGTRRHVTGKRTRPGDGSAHCRAVVYLVVRRDLHDGEHDAVEKCLLNPSSRCLSAPLVPQRDLVHAPLTSRHTNHLTSTAGSPLEHTAACRGLQGTTAVPTAMCQRCTTAVSVGLPCAAPSSRTAYC